MEYQYRFYTEQEFIELYGEDWRDIIPYGWTTSMNVFIGNILNIEASKLPIRYNGYLIGKEMLYSINNESEYTELLVLKKKLLLLKSKLTIIEKDTYLLITFKDIYSVTFSIFKSPTANCQTASIAAFENLLAVYSDNVILDILLILTERIGKSLFIIDVKDTYSLRLKDNLKIFEHYTSTNGSKMCLGLLKV